MQISLDGATAEVSDRVRGPGSFATATRALAKLAEAGMPDFENPAVATRRLAQPPGVLPPAVDRVVEGAVPPATLRRPAEPDSECTGYSAPQGMGQLEQLIDSPTRAPIQLDAEPVRCPAGRPWSGTVPPATLSIVATADHRGGSQLEGSSGGTLKRGPEPRPWNEWPAGSDDS